MMALGAVGDPALAARIGALVAADLRSAGVTIDFAPVLDLADAPASAVVGTRSFGDDPARVAALGIAFRAGSSPAASRPSSSIFRVTARRQRTRTSGCPRSSSPPSSSASVTSRRSRRRSRRARARSCSDISTCARSIRGRPRRLAAHRGRLAARGTRLHGRVFYGLPPDEGHSGHDRHGARRSSRYRRGRRLRADQSLAQRRACGPRCDRRRGRARRTHARAARGSRRQTRGAATAACAAGGRRVRRARRGAPRGHARARARDGHLAAEEERAGHRDLVRGRRANRRRGRDGASVAQPRASPACRAE